MMHGIHFWKSNSNSKATKTKSSTGHFLETNPEAEHLRALEKNIPIHQQVLKNYCPFKTKSISATIPLLITNQPDRPTSQTNEPPASHSPTTKPAYH